MTSQGGSAQLAFNTSFARSLTYTMSSSASMALYQWGVIVASARLTSTSDVGSLTLGLAISAPILSVVTTGLRLLQIRDVAFESTARRYVLARCAAVAPSFLLALGVAGLFRLGQHERIVVFGVITVKCIEAVSDACWSFFLQSNATKELVRVLFIRSSASIAGFSLALLMTGRTSVALAVLGSIAVALLVLVDLRRLLVVEKHLPGGHPGVSRPVGRILAAALPLGVASALTALNFNVPRYFLQHELGTDSVAVFSAMAASFAVLSLFTSAVGQNAIPRLALAVVTDRLHDFTRMLLGMVSLGLLAGLLAVAAGFLQGANILRAVYGSRFATEIPAFRWLLVALAISCIVTFLQDGLTVLDWKGSQVLGFGLGTATTAALCARWVPSSGVEGAAAALWAGSVAQLGFFAGTLIVALRRQHMRAHSTAPG